MRLIPSLFAGPLLCDHPSDERRESSDAEDASGGVPQDGAHRELCQCLAPSGCAARRHLGPRALRARRARAGGGALRCRVLRRRARPARPLQEQLRRLHRPRRPDQPARPDDGAAADGAGDQASRPRQHHLDDLLSALPDRAQPGLARPAEPRPGGVERRHLGDRLRGAQLRHGRRAAQGRALRPRRRRARSLLRAVGLLGRRRDGDGPRERRVRRCEQDPLRRPCRSLRPHPWPAVDPAQPAGPAADPAGRIVAARARVRRALGRHDLLHAGDQGRRDRVPHRHACAA